MVWYLYSATGRYGRNLYEALRPEDHVKFLGKENGKLSLFCAPGNTKLRREFVHWLLENVSYGK